MNAEIVQYLNDDEARLSKLASENQIQLSPNKIADFLGTPVQSVRSMIDAGIFGASWRKDGKLNKGYFVPTANFIRWYLNMSND